jgi:hypothetical protein
MSKIASLLKLSAVAILICLPIVGMSSHDGARAYRKTIDTFFAQALKDQIATFTSHPFEEQYAIYIYGNQVRHPPAVYLARPFGSEGARVVAPLSKKLIEAHDDLTIRDLVTIFSEISSQMTYDVAGDERLMTLLHNAVAGMKNPDWRAVAAKELQSIRNDKPNH